MPRTITTYLLLHNCTPNSKQTHTKKLAKKKSLGLILFQHSIFLYKAYISFLYFSLLNVHKNWRLYKTPNLSKVEEKRKKRKREEICCSGKQTISTHTKRVLFFF
jgi:hypothetical protein